MGVINRFSLHAAYMLAIISLACTVSGCADTVQNYIQIATPTSIPTILAPSTPVSTTPGVTITRSGNTLIFTGDGPYNVELNKPIVRKEPFTLNEGTAIIDIKLNGMGLGCSINLDYQDPLYKSWNFVPVLNFSKDREYVVSKNITVPYTQEYYLSVNWGSEWEVRITQ